jgi:hypothetical protein
VAKSFSAACWLRLEASGAPAFAPLSAGALTVNAVSPRVNAAGGRRPLQAELRRAPQLDLFEVQDAHRARSAASCPSQATPTASSPNARKTMNSRAL